MLLSLIPGHGSDNRDSFRCRIVLANVTDTLDIPSGSVVDRMPLATSDVRTSYRALLSVGDRLYAVPYSIDPGRGEDPQPVSPLPLVTLRIGQDGHPRIVDVAPSPDRHALLGAQRGLLQGLTVPLLPLPGLTAEERLAATVEAYGGVSAVLGGDVLATVSARRELIVYRLARLTPRQAAFELVAVREPTPLERLAQGGLGGRDAYHWLSRSPLAMRDGLLFVVGGYPPDSVTVYDLRRPERPRRIGHYTAPQALFNDVTPLPDGRVLLAGTELHVVRAPR